jgi:hypothetical protein
MSRVKLIVLGLMAAFALSAVASSTALATHEFKVEGKTIVSGEKVEVTGQAAQGQLESEVATTAVHLTCNQPGFAPVGATNVLQASGVAKAKIEFSGCTLNIVSGGKPEDVPGCKVNEGKTTVEAEGELGSGVPGQITFTVKAGELKIEKVGSLSCSLEGELKYKGSQVCDIPSWGFESTMGLLVCTGTGSISLKLGEKPAKLYLVGGVTTTSGKKLGQT